MAELNLRVSVRLTNSRRRDHMLAHARAALRRGPRNERPALMHRLVTQMCEACYVVTVEPAP